LTVHVVAGFTVSTEVEEMRRTLRDIRDLTKLAPE
jgi:hypothetical protein